MDVATEKSPLRTLEAWIADARALDLKDPDAMALATSTPNGSPSVRIVLCRAVGDDMIRFFTNYESRKGRELAANPRAAAVFHWAALERQVRVEGTVTRTASDVSDAYFANRPRGSQIASSVSPQSQPIASFEELLERHAKLEAELEGRDVARPSHWGGYELQATAVELWRAGTHRLHECVRYELRGSSWIGARRAP